VYWQQRIAELKEKVIRVRAGEITAQDIEHARARVTSVF
jgi:hypothetical protein